MRGILSRPTGRVGIFGVIVAMLVAIATSVPVAPAHATTSASLSISHMMQNKSQWCWNTAARVAVQYHKGSAMNQCDFHRKGKQASTCPNTPGSANDTIRAMKAYLSNGGAWAAGGLTSSRLVGEINSKRPVQAVWKYRNQTVGHMVTVHGYCSGCNGTTMVFVSNVDGKTGTSTTGAKRQTYTLAAFKSNNSFTNSGNIVGARK